MVKPTLGGIAENSLVTLVPVLDLFQNVKAARRKAGKGESVQTDYAWIFYIIREGAYSFWSI